MSYPNLLKYVEFEKAIRYVGEDRLKAYASLKGHRVNLFDRNMKIIRYTLQHGTHAASKAFHLSGSYPSTILYKYGRLAMELAKKIEKEKEERNNND